MRRRKVDESGAELKEIEVVQMQAKHLHDKDVSAIKANNDEILATMMQLSMT